MLNELMLWIVITSDPSHNVKWNKPVPCITFTRLLHCWSAFLSRWSSILVCKQAASHPAEGISSLKADCAWLCLCSLSWDQPFLVFLRSPSIPPCFLIGETFFHIIYSDHEFPLPQLLSNPPHQPLPKSISFFSISLKRQTKNKKHIHIKTKLYKQKTNNIKMPK